jgi:uncharacterized protein
MKAKLIDDGRQKTYAIMFDRGDEAIQGLRSFAAERRLAAAQFTGLAAHVRPTLEVILTESPHHLRKRLDPEVGVALIDLQE